MMACAKQIYGSSKRKVPPFLRLNVSTQITWHTDKSPTPMEGFLGCQDGGPIRFIYT